MVTALIGLPGVGKVSYLIICAHLYTVSKSLITANRKISWIKFKGPLSHNTTKIAV